jgi:hypothetical protein
MTERDYYVTLQRGSRTAWLAGPFATHFDALIAVDRAVKLANEIDQWAWFDPFGTCSLPRTAGNPKGKLNLQLGLDDL